jgi:hypothetical protein
VTVRTQLKDRPKDEFPYNVLAELLAKQGAQPGSAEFDEALYASLEAAIPTGVFAFRRPSEAGISPRTR